MMKRWFCVLLALWLMITVGAASAAALDGGSDDLPAAADEAVAVTDEYAEVSLIQAAASAEQEVEPATQAAAPLYPEITSMTNTAGGVQLRWSAYPGASSYRIYYQRGGKWSALGNSSTTSYVDTSAVAGAVRVYTVRAMNGASFVSSYNTAGYSHTFVAAPVIAKVQNTATGVQLTWGKCVGADRYRVFRRTTGGWSKLADTAALSYVDKTAKSGVKYTYTVRCLDKDGVYNSGYYASGKAITYIAAPVISKIDITNNGAVIKWKAVPGAAKYRVFYRQGSSWKKLGDTAAVSYTHASAKVNAKSTYTVRCISKDGKTYTGAYDTKGKSITRLATPVLKSAQLSDLYSSLSWKAVSGAKAYRIYYKGGQQKSWAVMGDTDVPYVDIDNEFFDNNTKYTFTVRCVNELDGNQFLSGFDAKGVSMQYYDTPRIAYVTNEGEEMRLYWNEVKGVAKYRVFVKEDERWVKLTDTAATGLRLSGMYQNQYVTVTVRGMDKNGKYITAYDGGGTLCCFYGSGWEVAAQRSFNTESIADNLTDYARDAGFVENTEPEGSDSALYFLDYTGTYGNRLGFFDDHVEHRGKYLINYYAKMFKRNNVKLSDLTFYIYTQEYEDGEAAFYLAIDYVK